jgi:hypothetical protein
MASFTAVASGAWNDFATTWIDTDTTLPAIRAPIGSDDVFIDGGFAITGMPTNHVASGIIAVGSFDGTGSLDGTNLTMSATSSGLWHAPVTLTGDLILSSSNTMIIGGGATTTAAHITINSMPVFVSGILVGISLTANTNLDFSLAGNPATINITNAFIVNGNITQTADTILIGGSGCECTGDYIIQGVVVGTWTVLGSVTCQTNYDISGASINLMTPGSTINSNINFVGAGASSYESGRTAGLITTDAWSQGYNSGIAVGITCRG